MVFGRLTRYVHSRDAQDAVAARDGYKIDGYRIKVEFPRGPSDRGADSFRGRGGGRGRGRGAGPPKRSDHRVLIYGLPATGSWQDLKDHMREAGDVLYADVFKDGSGVVEFARHNDMKWAINNLDDTKFRSHEVSICLMIPSPTESSCILMHVKEEQDYLILEN